MQHGTLVQGTSSVAHIVRLATRFVGSLLFLTSPPPTLSTRQSLSKSCPCLQTFANMRAFQSVAVAASLLFHNAYATLVPAKMEERSLEWVVKPKGNSR